MPLKINNLLIIIIIQWAWLMMKIVSWNVNGLKAVVKNRQTSLKRFLDHFDADIVCIQETKATSKLVHLQIVINVLCIPLTRVNDCH